MRRFLFGVAIACIPGAITIAGPIAVVVLLLRRLRAKNAVTVVRVPNTPVLKVMRGGKA